MNIYIKTYGCQMNERDSESAAALLQEAGHNIVFREEDADGIILNTCSVRELAERKAIGKLGIMKRLLIEKPHLIFGIMGCMAQRCGEELLQKIPHLDFAVGTDNIHLLPEIFAELVKERRKLLHIERHGADTPGIDAHRLSEEDLEGEITPKNSFQAFISIARGCNRFCSYCIVPYVRGRERCRDKESIIKEAEMLAAQGVVEIMLLGQNVAAYGFGDAPLPIPEDESPFGELLERLSQIEGLKRIRFTSPHPAFFNKALIEKIAALPKVCKCIHLPLQSGSDPILKAMNRPYTAKEYRKIVDSLRELCPEINFSTDIIVGFPGETREDFEETRKMMQFVAYDNAYIFKYSPREGTVSAKRPDDVPQEEKEWRNQELLAELEKGNAGKNASLVGRSFEILVEGPSKRNPRTWCGRTDTFKTVVFEPLPGVRAGDFITLKIVKATPMTLYGEME